MQAWPRLLTAVLGLLCGARAHLNLFVSQAEVMKLLGLSAELYYVRDGVVNIYAMNFVVPVPAHITDLEFSWQALTRAPLPYAWSFVYDNHDALRPPELDIPARGLVPAKVQTFRVRFPCSGSMSAEVLVLMQLNVSLYNDSALSFRRNKICLKETSSPRNESVRVDSSLITSSGTFYVAVACACLMILLVVAVASLVYVKSKKARAQESLHADYNSAAYGSNQNVFPRLDALGPSSGGSATGSSSPRYCSVAGDDHSLHVYATPAPRFSPSPAVSQVALHDPRLVDPTQRLKDLSVDRQNIELLSVLHEGTFGRIFLGSFLHNQRKVEVIVKTVSDQASKFQISLTLAEGTMFHGLSHKNLLSVLAVNTDNPKQPLVVYGYCNKGNLKRFLQSSRLGEQHCALLTQDLVDMGLQVVLAMTYLHARGVCHKDLAARNCAVNDKLQVKVADSALSRDLFPADYYCLGDNENRPIKWLALESLASKHFTAASDVWSFGVLLWELTTLAQQPYAEVDPFEMADYLRDGYRLAQPLCCPDELFALMACCWFTAPEERPAFSQLLSCLQEFYTALGRYI
ncbi:tyrosine-protein kinase Drl-like [Bacillus rossius redtenbacheri]|uniref:tyrosine-protein kinase Drl-like n=1 Tax=Bacillus rossius redtenbacheri TaxID=93214 RepID=UPI002FDCAD8F